MFVKWLINDWKKKNNNICPFSNIKQNVLTIRSYQSEFQYQRDFAYIPIHYTTVFVSTTLALFTSINPSYITYKKKIHPNIVSDKESPFINYPLPIYYPSVYFIFSFGNERKPKKKIHLKHFHTQHLPVKIFCALMQHCRQTYIENTFSHSWHCAPCSSHCSMTYINVPVKKKKQNTFLNFF